MAVDQEGGVQAKRVTCAIDCGLAANPDIVVAQMEGGIVSSLTAALWGEVRIAEGRLQQGNLHDYRVMCINEALAIEVHLIPSREHSGGAGEPGTSVAIPTVVNAVYAATGKRIRRLPTGEQLKA